MHISTLMSLSVLLFATSASAYELKTTSDGYPVHWARMPIHFVVDQDGARDLPLPMVQDAARRSFDAWAQAPGTGIGLVFDGVVPAALGYDRERPANNRNAVIWSRDAWTYGEEALAVTVTLFKRSSGELVDADIYVNEVNYAWGVGEEAENDLQNTLTHEVGHFLGLAHSEVREATMYGSAAPHELSKRVLDPDDVEGAADLYPGDTVAPAPHAPVDVAAFRDDQVEPPAAMGVEESAPAFTAPSVGCAVRPGAPPSSAWWSLVLLPLGLWRRGR